LKHICIISEEFPPATGWGGIATYSFEMAQYLSNKEVKVSVVAANAKTENDIVEYNPFLTVYGLGKKAYSFFNSTGFWRFNQYIHGFAYQVYKTVKKIHSETPIDIIEAPEFRANSLYCHKYLRNIPQVIRLHTSHKIIQELNDIYPLNKRMERWENTVMQKAFRRTAPTKAIIPLTYKKAGFNYTLPTEFIPNPINPDKLRLPKTLKKRTPSVIFVGRLEKRKGIELILKLLPFLFKSIPALHFTFLGSDGHNSKGKSYENLLKEAAGESYLNQLHFKKLTREEVPAEIAQHELAFFPSIWENCPYVLLEAMAVGTPALVSTSGGMAEIVVNEENGWHMPQSETEILQLITTLLNSPNQLSKAGNLATLHINKNYHTSVIGSRMLEYYKETIFKFSQS
jgi:glycosyltransferase involved in cell wall biosynthesis